MKSHLALRTGVFVAAIVLAGCGGGGSDSSSTQTGGGSTPPPASQPDAGTTPAPAPPADGSPAPAPAPAPGTATWSTPAAAAGSEAATKSTVAIDGTGKGFVTWSAAGGAVKAARQAQAGGTWENAVSLGATGAPADATPQIMADQAGNAIAVWVQQQGGVNVVMANHFAADQGTWSTPQQISKDTTSASIEVEAVQDGAGNGVALWSWNASNGATTEAATDVARFDATTKTWPATPTQLMRRSGSNAPGRIAANAAGDVVATWVVDTESQTAVYTSRLDRTTSTWGTGTEAPYPGAFPKETLGRVAVLGDGTTLKAWVRRAGGQATPYAPVLTVAQLGADGKIVGQAQQVATLTDTTVPEFVEVHALGDTGSVIVWGTRASGVSWQYRPAPATAGKGGDRLVEPTLVLNGTEQAPRGPEMATTADGKVLLAICRSGGGPEVRSFDPTSQAWTTVVVTSDTESATSCDVATSSSGAAAVSWQPAGKGPVVSTYR